MVDIASSLCAKIADYIVEPIGRQLGYVFFYKKNINQLKQNVEMLEWEKKEIVHKIEEARRNAESIEDVASNWLIDVGQITDRARDLLRVVSPTEGENKCCKGSYLNLVSRHQLSRNAKKLTEDIVRTKVEKGFSIVSYRIPLEPVGTGKDYEDFESRKELVKQIMESLSNPDIHKIGVWGMGGTGKTKFVEEIVRRATRNLFNEVAMVTVSETPDLRKVITGIGEKLGLTRLNEYESLEAKAALLRQRLSNGDKILIVLDDVWKHLDLEDVGIDFGEYQERCKIIVTSRYQNVLSQYMDNHTIFKLTELSKAESWTFFKNIVGPSIEDPSLERYPMEVANECGGLPLALSIVAGTLKNKEKNKASIWRNALAKLRKPCAMKGDVIYDKVYKTLEWSFDYLSEEAKSLFLLFGVFPEDYDVDIEELFTYAVGMGFLSDTINTLADARDRVISLVDNLIDSSLLLEGNDGSVKMHDVVRDVAIIKVSQSDKQIHASRDIRLDTHTFGEATAVFISSAKSDFHGLRQKLVSPELEFLVAKLNIPELGILMFNGAFEGMRKLKFLELKRMSIPQLSPTFDCLLNLRVLTLCGCELGDLGIIGKLKNLEMLSFSGSNITELPSEIGNLSQLKMLDLTYCQKFQVIQPNVISRLTALEELYIGESFSRWEGENMMNDQRKNASVSELKSLSQLKRLHICIEDANILPKDLPLGNLENFAITIGCKQIDFSIYRNSKCLHLKQHSDILSNTEFRRLLEKTQELMLEELVGVSNIFSRLDAGIYPHLERLRLRKMMELEKVIDEKHGVVTFNKLRSIKVQYCHRLKLLFSSSVIKGLPQLQKIDIRDCNMMEEIVYWENEDPTSCKIQLCQLVKLFLSNLPCLRSFCSSSQRRVQPSEGVDDSEASTINKDNELGMMSTFFDEQITFPNLKILELKGAINVEMIWKDQLAVKSFYKLEKLRLHELNKLKHVWSGDSHTLMNFQNLKTVDVFNCINLKSVCPTSIAKNLSKLEKLSLRNCGEVEEIIARSGRSEMADQKELLFPELKKLHLSDLDNLSAFYLEIITLKMPSLEALTVVRCPKLKVFGSEISNLGESDAPIQPPVFCIEKVSLTKLKRLTVDNYQLCQELYDGQFSEDLFHNLKSLILSGFITVPYKFVERLHNLEDLDVEYASVEEISMCRGFSIDDEEKHSPTFSRLKRFGLSNLPKLKHLGKTSEISPIFQYLETLDLEKCGIANMVLPRSKPLQNLMNLKVKECDELVYLFNSSTAKCLAQLKRIHLEKCKMMNTVLVAREEDEENEEIVFRRLEYLGLFDLINFTSFSSGKCTIRFPCLKYVVLNKCPDFKIFSNHGIVHTPILHQVFDTKFDGLDWWFLPDECAPFEENRKYWNENINATIQQIWEYKHAQAAHDIGENESHSSDIGARLLLQMVL